MLNTVYAPFVKSFIVKVPELEYKSLHLIETHFDMSP